MNLLELLLPAVIVVLLAIPLVGVFKGKANARTAKKRLVTHICSFFALVAGCLLYTISGAVNVSAATEAANVGSIIGTMAQGLGFIAAALATGCSALGAGIAVAAAAPAAIGAISENENNFGKSLIFVALGEGVAIYGLLISILIINKL